MAIMPLQKHLFSLLSPAFKKAAQQNWAGLKPVLPDWGHVSASASFPAGGGHGHMHQGLWVPWLLGHSGKQSTLCSLLWLVNASWEVGNSSSVPWSPAQVLKDRIREGGRHIPRSGHTYFVV